MAFNPRSSASGRTGQKQPPSSHKHRQQQQAAQEANDFLMLKPADVIECLQGMGLPFDLAALDRPQPQHICMIFEQLLAEHTGIAYTSTLPILSAITTSSEYEYEHPDSMTDTLKVLACFRSLRRLMDTCNIKDFQLNDLLNPEPVRLLKMFSYVINYARFQTEQKKDIDQYAERAEELKLRVEDLYHENDELQHKVQTLSIQRAQEQPLVDRAKEAKMAYNAELRKLKEDQNQVVADLDRLKVEKKTLKDKLKEAQYLSATLQQECAKIRPYIVDEPGRLQQANADMGATLASEKAQLAAIERRTRALFTTADSFSVIETDVNACIKVMEECEAELIREEEDLKKAQRHRDVLRKKGLEVQDMEKKEAMLKARLDAAREKVGTARKQAEGKGEGAKRRMGELNEVYLRLAQERNEKGYDMERKKDQIDKAERRIARSKEVYEEEMRETHLAFNKLNQHITQYIHEMQKAMVKDV